MGHLLLVVMVDHALVSSCLLARAKLEAKVIVEARVVEALIPRTLVRDPVDCHWEWVLKAMEDY
jgi:hypothetical protein